MREMRPTMRFVVGLVALAALVGCGAASSSKSKTKDVGSGATDNPFTPPGGDGVVNLGGDTSVPSADATGEDGPDDASGGSDADGQPPTDSGGGVDAVEEPVVDTDGDGISDKLDNCKALSNADQANLDGDGFGDACDPDKDGDGANDDKDCAPYDELVAPGTFERCNGIDDNCDDITDGPDSKGCTPYLTDADGDGAGASGTAQCLCGAPGPGQVAIAGDCDDANGAIGPLESERCNGVDDNCNLLIDDGCDDDGDDYCDKGFEVVGVPTVCPLGGGDCIDYSPEVHPGAVDVPGDTLDNDCDGVKAGEGGGTTIAPSCAGKLCLGASTDAFLCALDICYPGLQGPASVGGPYGDDVTGAWGAVAHFGAATNDLSPFAGPSYAVLSTGTFSGSSASPQTGDSLGNGIETPDPYSLKDAYTDMNDVVEFKVTLTAPTGATGIALDYIFMSAEYEEFIGTSFNDKFYIVLQGPQTTGGVAKVINVTKCSDPGSYFDYEEAGVQYCYIAINTAFSEKCSDAFSGAPEPPTDISGTGYACTTGSSTGWLTTQWPITSGETFTLTFHIHDTTDEIYDSLVLLDNFRFLGGTFTQGTASHN
jgi:hypothetical protein